LAVQQTSQADILPALSVAQAHIIQALLYFDIFSYPLRLDEIKRFTRFGITDDSEFRSQVFELLNAGLIQSRGEFFGIALTESKIQQRMNGNKSALKLMHTAKRFSKLISRFPYVQCVCISGSLSKGYVDELGDIDYFIITKPGRLWIARTLLIAFKKLFLLNSRKYFCVNYFIDTDHLEIPDKNIFTATEVQTLLPMYQEHWFNAFLEANRWSIDHLPNQQRNANPSKVKTSSYPIKTLIERALNNKLGDRLDSWFMALTMKRWQRKFAHFTPEYFDHALRTRKYVSKHHPQNFQKRVLDTLAQKVKEFELQHGTNLTSNG